MVNIKSNRKTGRQYLAHISDPPTRTTAHVLPSPSSRKGVPWVGAGRVSGHGALRYAGRARPKGEEEEEEEAPGNLLTPPLGSLCVCVCEQVRVCVRVCLCARSCNSRRLCKRHRVSLYLPPCCCRNKHFNASRARFYNSF